MGFEWADAFLLRKKGMASFMQEIAQHHHCQARAWPQQIDVKKNSHLER